LDKLGRYQQWPWSYHAKVIDFLTKSGVKAIGFDILFIEENQIKEQSDSLVEATLLSDKVHHALYFSSQDSDMFRHKLEEDPLEKIVPQFAFHFDDKINTLMDVRDIIEGPFVELAQASKGLGFVNPYPDADGVVRQTPYFVRILNNAYPSFSLRMAMDILGVENKDVKINLGKNIVLGDKITIPINKNVYNGSMQDGWGLIYYYGTYKTFRYISFYDVLKRRVPPSFFKDKITLVGTSAAGLMDLRSTPFSPIFPGVEIHATLLQNILNNNYVVKSGLLMTILILVGLGSLVGVISLRLKPVWGTLLTILLIVSYIFISYKIFVLMNVWIEVIRPIFTILFTYTSIMLYRFTTEEREKRFIRGAFQQYLAPSVISQLMDNPEFLKLGGEKKVLTAFFSDVASFSTISEKLTPDELVNLLNEYLTDMTDIILEHEGTVDKFEGDAIIAFFGAPVPYDDHARRACLVSIDMQLSLGKLREKWSQEPHWPEIVSNMRMRIGLNTGPMVVGNMGSKTRMDYTMMGDSVNLAARLEGANKQYGTYNMISEYTYNAAKDFIEVRELDIIRVVGKSEPVRVYELLSKKGELSQEDQRHYEIYTQGLLLYRDQQWDKAREKFEETQNGKPDDEPSKRYIIRCDEFKQKPPPADWDGVYTLTSK